jgi:hypothetical protein
MRGLYNAFVDFAFAKLPENLIQSAIVLFRAKRPAPVTTASALHLGCLAKI